MSRSDRGDRGRWLAEGQTDEGTMIERFRLSEGVSPPRRRVSFWGPRKKPKRHQGVSAIGGRVRTPAPTEYPKVRLIFCRARCPHRAVPGRPGVPPLRNAGIFQFGRRGRRPRRPAGAHCAPLRRKTDRGRWFGKLRRRRGTAPKADFANTGPLWARKNRTQALLILRAGNVLPLSGECPS